MVKSTNDKIYFNITIVVLLILTLIFVVKKSTKKVDQLNDEIDNRDLIIDSLQLEIDTLL